MGARGDGENPKYSSSSRKNVMCVDLREMETQQIDSQYSPGGASEDDGPNDFLYLSDTMLVGDTQPLDDLETQLVNLEGETQLVDLSDETQAADDFECMNNMQMEFLNDFNFDVDDGGECDDAKGIEDLCDTQVLSPDNTNKIDDYHNTVELAHTMENYPHKKSDNTCGASPNADTNEECYSGSVSRGFTSIRVASVRASGLAASARGASGGLSTCGSDKISPKQKFDIENSMLGGSSMESGRQLSHKNNENSEELNKLSKGKVGSRAMRKLFRENDDADHVQSDNDNNDTNDNPEMLEFPTSENCFAGLSYANSQEPGELSQAHALEVVDKFLDLNASEFEEGLWTTVRSGKKLNIVTGVKGSFNLAKCSFLKSKAGERGIYDWDNNREDEGGGDFFQKKKELFFDKGGLKKRCTTEPRKHRHADAGSVEPLVNNVDRTEQICTKNKSGDTVYSDSRLMLHDLRDKGKLLKGDGLLHNNIMKNLDEQLNHVSGSEFVENDKRKDSPGMNNIGLDTQMAAEAMETLCFEVHLDDSNNNACNKGTCGPAKGTRKSNQITPPEKCLTAKKAHSRSATVTKKKRAASINTCNGFSLITRQSSKIREKSDAVLQEVEHRELPEMESTGHGSAAKIHYKKQLESSVPVAHRTRKCTELNHCTAAVNSLDAREDTKDLISTHVLGKKRTTGKHKNVRIVTIEQVKKIGLAAIAQSRNSWIGTSSASNAKSVDKEQGKRRRPDTMPVGQDAVTQHGEKFKKPREAEQSGAETSAECTKTNGCLETTPRAKSGISTPSWGMPATCGAPESDVSPICMGDEYHKQSCRKNLARVSLIKEMNRLVTASPGPSGGTKDLRKRKDITQIKVLFSQHLDEGVVKKQKKILSQLGGGVASSMSDASHFVTDEFVRTRNMLEAIAGGKPVVTHLWLKSCGQANCLIEEKNYILRDAKKEREFGFSLPVSLSRARQHQILEGQKVFITPNTKPGKDILANLVKAVHGLPIERLGRSALKDEKLPDDLLILSCEEDYDICVPFLKKDGAIYSSELLLNGIVKQKLEYERHRLFDDHVKKTRSTIWVKKKSQYIPVTKCK